MSTWPFEPLPMFGFDAVVIDPPWDFETWSEKGGGKGPRPHYATMKDSEIAALPVGQLVAGPGWCFLWTVSSKLPLAIACLERWGFRYVSTAAWEKRTKNDRMAVGTGYVVRSMHENVLIGAVGKPAYRKALPSLFRGERREHSRKPDRFYELLDGFLPQDYRRVDIFSRESRPGWVHWGREAGKFDRGAA